MGFRVVCGMEAAVGLELLLVSALRFALGLGDFASFWLLLAPLGTLQFGLKRRRLYPGCRFGVGGL